MNNLTCAVMAALLTTSAFAQGAATPLPAVTTTSTVGVPVPAPASVAVLAAPQPSVLRSGLTVPMRTMEELTTRNKVLRVGQRVPLEVAEDVRVGGIVVIPAGSPGMGEIMTVRNKGMWGKSGYFSGHVLYVRAGERQIRMSGTFDDKGVAGGGAAAATSAIIFLPAGFFMTGTSAFLPKGAPVVGYLDEDVAVAAQVPATPVSATAPVAAPQTDVAAANTRMIPVAAIAH